MDKIFAEWINTKIITTQYWEIVKVWVKIDDFKKFLDTHNKNWWVNLNLMTSKDWQKKYFELDTWVPDSAKKEVKPEDRKQEEAISIEDIPFN